MFGASASTMMFLTTSLTFPAKSFMLYTTCFVPTEVVSTLLGVIVNPPSNPDNASLYVTPLFKSTVTSLFTIRSPTPSIFGAVLSNLIVVHFLSVVPSVLLAIAHK